MGTDLHWTVSPLIVLVLHGAQDVDVGVNPGLGHVADLDPGAVDGWNLPGAARASESSAGRETDGTPADGTPVRRPSPAA
jgi:hypothetical protein